MGNGVLYRLALLTALVLSPVVSEARQLSSLITDARLLASDNGSSRRRFTDAQITAFINDGQSQAISRSWCVQKSTSFQLASGTTYYATPSDFVAVRRITKDKLNLQEMTPAGLDGRSRGWENSSGPPTYYFLNYSTRGVIGFAPFPGATTDTGTVKMDYFARVADLSASTDHPYNGIIEMYDFHHGLPYYAAFKMALIEGRINESNAYLTQWEIVLKTMGERCTDRPNYLPSASGRP